LRDPRNHHLPLLRWISQRQRLFHKNECSLMLERDEVRFVHILSLPSSLHILRW
jgi:hypothetical protein